MLFRSIISSVLAALCFSTFTEASLNIGEYLQYADDDKIYPSVRQIEMLKSAVRAKKIQPAPSINDRIFWDKVATSDPGKAYLAEAESMLDKKPEVPISDERYRKANETGQRGMYKPRYYDTMKRLEHFMLAECLENKGRFLSQVETYLQAIMEMKSWTHPNHDPECRVLEGKAVRIDLGARLFGTDLALAELLLGNRLSGDLRKEIPLQLRRRIIDSYFRTCRGEDEENHWLRSTSNWNSVCTSGSLFVILSAGNADERIAAIGCALNSMPFYLSGFGADGYCSEGIGYWGYGFGHYLYLARILHDYTDGQIDLFAFNNPEKLQRVAHYPGNIHIQNGIFPAFSDSNITNPSDFGNFCKAITAKHYDTRWPYSEIHEHAHEQLVQWTALDKSAATKPPAQAGHSFFDDRGIVVSRGGQAVPFSIAFKAGDNAENHNHSDVGSYSLILGEDLMAGDIGKPVYIAGAFSSKNKARSSWGHPVPCVDRTLQANGKKQCGKITNTEFSEICDTVVMDIKAAYELDILKSLTRTMENDKSGSGVITIADRFSASEPIEFGTAIMTYADIATVDENTLLLTTENQSVRVTITTEEGSVTLKREPVPVRLGSGMTAVRIGVDFTKPVKNGIISVRYEPVNKGKK